MHPSADRSKSGSPVDERSLAVAFSSFTAAAHSLERSYAKLQSEVARLRCELEETNSQLASSLEENQRVWRHLNSILESLPCAVIVADGNSSVSLVNPEARRLFTLAPRQQLPAGIEGGATCEEREITTTEGAKWLSIRRAELQGGREGTQVIVAEDVTEIRRLQQERDGLRRREALAEMSSVLAHEIRNPLASLELFAGLLADGDLGDEQRQWVEHLQGGLRMLTSTVNNVLQFHSDSSLQAAPLKLGGFVRDVAGFIAPLAMRAAVAVEVEDCVEQLSASMDRHRMQQVFFNLCSNALRSMPDGGTLTIFYRRAPDEKQERIQIGVRDTGCGIQPEYLLRIFEPGFSTRAGSPGLGLSVCKGIVEQHGGRIMVLSEPGVGSTFYVELPGGRK
jgi:signal transduction histidine kinase